MRFPAVAAVLVGLVLVVAAPTHASELRVVLVQGLELADLRALAKRGAVGLLVPGSGPETSEAQAKAAVLRGKVRNSLLGGEVSGPPLIRVETAAAAPVSGRAIVLALPRGGRQTNDRRYPIAVLAPGYEGLLRSRSTRIPGLVSVVDVAPTALGRKGRLGATRRANPVAALVALDARIEAKGNARMPAFLLAAGLVALLALVHPRAGGLALAGALCANLVLGIAGASALWIVLLATALGTGAGALLGLFVRSPGAVGTVLAAVVAGYLVTMALDASAVALSPLGPAQRGRFFGVSNLLSTLLLVPAFAAAALLARRFGPVGFAGAAALALVAVGGNRLGADGGGVLVLGAGFAVLAVTLAGGGSRRLALALPAIPVLALALLGLDAITGGSSHVTRAVGRGPADLASDLARRIRLSYEVATERWYTLLVVLVGIAVLAALLAKLLRSADARRGRPVLVAQATAVAVSLVVNDSPRDVVVAGLLGCLVTARYPGDS